MAPVRPRGDRAGATVEEPRDPGPDQAGRSTPVTEVPTRAGARGPALPPARRVPVRARRDRSAPPRDRFEGPHARPAPFHPGRLDARSGYLTADPEAFRYHCGADVTVWPLRGRRPVVRALLLHGPAALAWERVGRRGRFRVDAGTPRDAGTGWPAPVLLLLDARDVPVRYVPLHAWHPWGPLPRPGHPRGPRPAPEASRAAAADLLERTGWSALLLAARLPLSDARSAREEALRRVVTASGGRAFPPLTAPHLPRAVRGVQLLSLLAAGAVGALQWGLLPTSRDGAGPREPSLDGWTLALWGAVVGLALLARLLVSARQRRAARRFPAGTALGAPGGVELLLRARPDGRTEWGVRELGREAWFPVDGPGVPVALTLAHGPAQEPRHRIVPEVRVTVAGGAVVSRVPVHALQDRPPSADVVDDATRARLEAFAARVGCRFEVLDRAEPLPTGDGAKGYRSSPFGLFAALQLGMTVSWSVRIALSGAGSWWVVPAGLLALAATVRLLWFRPPRDRVRNAPVLRGGGV